MSKVQHYSFTSLDLVLPAAATLGLMPICYGSQPCWSYTNLYGSQHYWSYQSVQLPLCGLKQARRQRLAVSTLSLRGLISTPLSTYFSDLGPCYTLLDGMRAGRLVKL